MHSWSKAVKAMKAKAATEVVAMVGEVVYITEEFAMKGVARPACQLTRAAPAMSKAATEVVKGKATEGLQPIPTKAATEVVGYVLMVIGGKRLYIL